MAIDENEVGQQPNGEFEGITLEAISPAAQQFLNSLEQGQSR